MFVSFHCWIIRLLHLSLSLCGCCCYVPMFPPFSSQYNSWISQTGLKKEIIVLSDNAVRYNRQAPLSLYATLRETALNGFKRALTGLDGLWSETCKVQMLLFFSHHNHVKTLTWCESRFLHVQPVRALLCVSIKFVRMIPHALSGVPPVFGVCSLAYILIGIQPALQADCRAGVASAAGSLGILSPDPDSHYLCYTVLPHKHKTKSFPSAFAKTFCYSPQAAWVNKTVKSATNSRLSPWHLFVLLHKTCFSELRFKRLKHISVPTLMFISL